MTPAELRAQLRARRRQLRERVGQRPQARGSRRKRRVLRLVGLGVAVLLLLMMRCECERPPIAPAGQAPPTEPPPPKPVPPKPSSKPKVKAKVEPLGRLAFRVEPSEAAGWLEDFQLQVAARSPRLAQCFTGAERPGALRWTSALNAQTGVVSDHLLEPVGASAELTRLQRECVVQALSAPPYRLRLSADQPLPERVSVVIEF